MLAPQIGEFKMPPSEISYNVRPADQRASRDLAVYIYSSLLFVTAIAVLATLISRSTPFGSAPAVAALAAMALWAERQCVRLDGKTRISIAFLPLVFSAVVFGPLAAMAVATASLLGDFG